MEDYTNMRGFVSAFSASMEVKDGNYGIFALDCEMCYTTHGNELTRVTVVNYEGETVYEALVKPSRDVIDYNTRFSGISPKDLENVSTSIRDVQAVLLSMISSETILIGHSLESDLKALKASLNEIGGHDSAEDALAALDLMKVKVKSDVKKLQQDSSKAKM
ncbi:REX1_ RNA exonuclease 1 -like protein (Silurana) [Caligus rogercresseyi]|uniref:REX1_ RNA exonuclease 1 -like protein (Silurana) n=1 Tax=Caligus rogercresseyi TaxID=217165 RepID=A0A7T8H183_CALRO|nr:REX1_ RNA exonuclease 1 -like protein (Silurana) [Caligus rogercresseyi]